MDGGGQACFIRSKNGTFGNRVWACILFWRFGLQTWTLDAHKEDLRIQVFCESWNSGREWSVFNSSDIIQAELLVFLSMILLLLLYLFSYATHPNIRGCRYRCHLGSSWVVLLQKGRIKKSRWFSALGVISRMELMYRMDCLALFSFLLLFIYKLDILRNRKYTRFFFFGLVSLEIE